MTTPSVIRTNIGYNQSQKTFKIKINKLKTFLYGSLSILQPCFIIL